MKAKIHAWGRDWEWFGKDLGRVLGRFWMLLGSFGPLFGLIFSCLHSEWSFKIFWVRFWRHFKGFGRDIGFRGFGLEFAFKISSCFCLLLFAWACVCVMKCGTCFELKLWLCCLLFLAFACFGLFS